MNVYLRPADAVRATGLEGKLSRKDVNKLIGPYARTRGQWYKLARRTARQQAKLARAMQSSEFVGALYRLLSELGERFKQTGIEAAKAAGMYQGYIEAAEAHDHALDSHEIAYAYQHDGSLDGYTPAEPHLTVDGVGLEPDELNYYRFNEVSADIPPILIADADGVLDVDASLRANDLDRSRWHPDAIERAPGITDSTLTLNLRFTEDD